MPNLSCVIFLLSALSFSYHDPTSSLAGAWCSMFGAWCMVQLGWCLVNGALTLVHGVIIITADQY